jgi:hypothetical protein
MATYQGMTYNQIRNFAVTFAQKAGVLIEHGEAIGVFDEAMMKVGEDVLEASSIASVTWPATDQIALLTGGYMYPESVFGDATELIFIPYDNYREMFLGSSSLKSSIDNNIYYTINGDILFVEPDVTDFTNIVIKYAPRFTTYATRSGIGDIPELQSEYRILVSYKICALLFPRQFERVYQKILDEKRANKNNKLSTGHADWWDPYEDSENDRISGYPNLRDEA